jgi:hypothetical protein
MGTKIKPVQSTEIKDKKIIGQVIREIRRKPTPEAIAKMKAEDETFRKMLAKRVPVFQSI